MLIPWLAVDPAAVLPGRGPAADLLAALPEKSTADVLLRADLSAWATDWPTRPSVRSASAHWLGARRGTTYRAWAEPPAARP